MRSMITFLLTALLIAIGLYFYVQAALTACPATFASGDHAAACANQTLDTQATQEVDTLMDYTAEVAFSNQR